MVAVRSGALPEIVEHGRTGLIVDHEAELAGALRAASALDARACRAEAERRFGAGRMPEGYLRLYRSLGAGRP